MPENEIPEKSLDSHHETLWGTQQNRDTGLVPIVKEVVDFLKPIRGFVKGAKWPVTIVLGGILAAMTGGIVNLVRMFLSGGRP